MLVGYRVFTPSKVVVNRISKNNIVVTFFFSIFNQSVENCVCILHNLTYQLEAECPECFQKYQPQVDSEFNSQKSPIGCFSPKSAKAQKEVSSLL